MEVKLEGRSDFCVFSFIVILPWKQIMVLGPGGSQLVNNALFVLWDSKIVVHTWEPEPEDRKFEGSAWLPSEFEAYLC